jgi:hypothetical protein
MSSTRTAKSGPTLIEVNKKLKPAEAVVRMCVSGDLYGQHQQLEDRLDAAMNSSVGSGKLNDTGRAERQRLAEQIRKLEARMDREAYDFLFRKLPGNEWSDLEAEHPPRDGDDVDRRFGVNTATMAAPAVQRCCVSPTGFDDPAAFTAFWEGLSDGQRDRLFLDGAFAANRARGAVPKSVNASVVMSRSQQNSGSAAG